MRDLARTIPDPDAAATAVDALFDVDPSSAAAIAEERLAGSLGARCVPATLTRTMASRGLDPFRPVERRLDELDCDRSRLRPDYAISYPADDAQAEASPYRAAARAAAERMSPGKCRKAFEALFGLTPPPP